ncbi:MAG: hypothetical protein HDQ97_15475 [Lachnospiraceae bacterium]|nr:hypothetical protein [Lachnospiraceae bacterium]
MYFEWLYTQFIDNDTFVNIILHRTSMFGDSNVPYISFCIYNNSDGILHKRYVLSENVFNQLYNAFLCIDSKEINFEFEDISFNGIFYNLNRKNICEILYSEQNKQSLWEVLIPDGEFRGSICIQGFKYKLNAKVYQDKQYGNLLIQDFLKEWNWCVISEPQKTKCCFTLKCCNGIERTIKWVCDKYELKIEHVDSNEEHFFSVMQNENTKYMPKLWQDKEMIFIQKETPLRNRYEKIDKLFFNYKRFVCKNRNGVLCGVCENMKITKG